MHPNFLRYSGDPPAHWQAALSLGIQRHSSCSPCRASAWSISKGNQNFIRQNSPSSTQIIKPTCTTSSRRGLAMGWQRNRNQPWKISQVQCWSPLTGTLMPSTYLQYSTNARVHVHAHITPRGPACFWELRVWALESVHSQLNRTMHRRYQLMNEEDTYLMPATS